MSTPFNSKVRFRVMNLKNSIHIEHTGLYIKSPPVV